jgi:hypothetical protein
MPDRQVIHHTYTTANRPGGQYPDQASARTAAMATLAKTPGALPQVQQSRTCADGSYDCEDRGVDEVQSMDVVVPASGGRRRRRRGRKSRRGRNKRGRYTRRH